MPPRARAREGANPKIMKFYFPLLAILFAGASPANFVCAADELDVVISEICWTGTKISSSDEWIELRNNTESDINITSWTLRTNDNSPNIIFKPKQKQNANPSDFLIPKNTFYLLERTNDDSVPGIKADYIYTGALNNSGERLELRDSQGSLIDVVDFRNTDSPLPAWPAGNNKTKKTMERIDFLAEGSDPHNWKTSANPGGTPSNSRSEKSIVKPHDNSAIFYSAPAENNNLSVAENKSENSAHAALQPGIQQQAGAYRYLIAGLLAFFSSSAILAIKHLCAKN